jgi:small-conductance mechanosensitive channel
MQDWVLKTELFSIPVWNWLLTFAVSVAVFGALCWVRHMVRERLRRADDSSSNSVSRIFFGAIGSTTAFALVVVAMLIGVKMLDMPVAWQLGLSQLWFVAVVLQVTLWASTAITFGIDRHLARHPDVNKVTMTIVGFAARAVLWAVAVLAVLDNMGINITAFVASLGIGGVAVALAAQVVLADLFASISIGLDKPFEPGDFIVVGAIAGNIEHVGLKTTRIRSLGGEQIVCSNTELLKQTIQNYKRMELRRIAFRFVIAYGAELAKAQAIIPSVKKAIVSIEGTRFDRAHLLQFSERGLEYEVVYYVLSSDYNRYMDIQQEINFSIMRQIQEEGLEFGRAEMRVHYPTDQTPSPVPQTA